MQLSHSMAETLQRLLEIKFCVDYNDRSLRALERRGLVKWFPYAKPEPWVRGCYKLTPFGKKIALENT